MTAVTARLALWLTTRLTISAHTRLGGVAWGGSIGREPGDVLDLDPVTEQSLDIGQERLLLVADQGDRVAVRARAAGSADAVDVIGRD